MNSPWDDDYDDTSLHIPKKFWTGKDGFTPCMTQYWTIKENNLEKILFFKLGKFYEIFYDDAIKCQKVLDLNWMGGAKKLHVGFPEKALDKYLALMVNLGYKVAVIEQTETPRDLEDRNNKRPKGAPKEKCVNREISEMVTRGTFQPKDQGYEPRYILAYKKHKNLIGVTFFDVTTSKIHIGEFVEDDENQM
jgi:DNA mismatch repair protein MSH6